MALGGCMSLEWTRFNEVWAESKRHPEELTLQMRPYRNPSTRALVVRSDCSPTNIHRGPALLVRVTSNVTWKERLATDSSPPNTAAEFEMSPE